ncbi:hypothetical protein QCA50_018564 [Cerrena zonata]|uniref:Uncharacterized protein n=1 Tax=Cerrena zonata TaxID=2478898 RepID=A0AAW0FAX9_9APHY
MPPPRADFPPTVILGRHSAPIRNNPITEGDPSGMRTVAAGQITIDDEALIRAIILERLLTSLNSLDGIKQPITEADVKRLDSCVKRWSNGEDQQRFDSAASPWSATVIHWLLGILFVQTLAIALTILSGR